MIRTLRLKHSYKNILVLFGGLYAGLILPVEYSFLHLVVAVIAFICCSSVNYVLNEYYDRNSDKYHLEKQHRYFVQNNTNGNILYLLIALQILFSIFAFKTWGIVSGTCIALYFVNSIFYNIPPVRLKDRFFIDSSTESLNSLYRFLFGYYVVSPNAPFPNISLILSMYFFANVLMFNKRRKEYLYFESNRIESRVAYRKSFIRYNKTNLKAFTIGSFGLSLLFLLLFISEYLR